MNEKRDDVPVGGGGFCDQFEKPSIHLHPTVYLRFGAHDGITQELISRANPCRVFLAPWVYRSIDDFFADGSHRPHEDSGGGVRHFDPSIPRHPKSEDSSIMGPRSDRTPDLAVST